MKSRARTQQNQPNAKNQTQPRYACCRECLLVYDATDRSQRYKHSHNSDSITNPLFILFIFLAAVLVCIPVYKITSPVLRKLGRWLLWRPLFFTKQTMSTQIFLLWWDIRKLVPVPLLLLRVVLRGGVLIFIGVYIFIIAWPIVSKILLAAVYCVALVYAALELLTFGAIRAWRHRGHAVEWMRSLKSHAKNLGPIVLNIGKETTLFLCSIPLLTGFAFLGWGTFLCSTVCGSALSMWGFLLRGVGFVALSIHRFSAHPHAQPNPTTSSTSATRAHTSPTTSSKPPTASRLGGTRQSSEEKLRARLAQIRDEEAALREQLGVSGQTVESEGEWDPVDDDDGMPPLEEVPVYAEEMEYIRARTTQHARGASGSGSSSAKPSTHTDPGHKKKKNKNGNGKRW